MFDNRISNEDLLNEWMSLRKDLHDINMRHSLDLAQKAKIRWSIEGDENSKFFHGNINKKRSHLAIRGVLVEGDWIDDPVKVKNEFLNHFSNHFSMPSGPSINLDPSMFKQLSLEQNIDLECDVTTGEIKRAVWDCGTNKSSGPDGFAFEFIRTYWKIINQDVINAVREFFATSKFPSGSNSLFITLIPKKQDANLVKDFRPISLIGSFYKIIAKILANRLNMVISDLISDVQSAFVPNRQILDGPFILNELISWCKFHKSKAMIFKVDFEKAFDSVRWDYLDGILSKWDRVNVVTIVRMLKCFFMASGLQINIHKSKLMGIGVSHEEVKVAAKIIGCATFIMPFTYLGVKVGISSSRRNSWDDVTDNWWSSHIN
ncbi:RNA-directed DNA polymerase, eukaryota [Tanacetum coccineum]|uniref:RNA-directed DNA polymerase, eukaryota n=1 Tax=Tanacetum coccineum TaxID=301880 RepID=A0ABQ5HA39_9ASTR